MLNHHYPNKSARHLQFSWLNHVKSPRLLKLHPHVGCLKWLFFPYQWRVKGSCFSWDASGPTWCSGGLPCSRRVPRRLRSDSMRRQTDDLGLFKVWKKIPMGNPLLAESIGFFFFLRGSFKQVQDENNNTLMFFVHCIQKQTSYSTYNRINIWRCPTMGVYHDLPLLFFGFVHEINHPATGVPPRL